ncbi:CLUMA_CG004884, isoform A [Clunio marinus]|uniref:CLUMA_CG004884, isoform A n=1 Tax=Clunio marinus TaxID=568069 RepID=A0A1J1HYJ6_9DIPT|nr:CLUMA_CG004884, isoform A [Clunio marinus]
MVYKVELNKNNRNRPYRKISLENPFIRYPDNIWDEENIVFDITKTIVLTVLLVPLRIFGILTILLVTWSIACIGIFGITHEELKRKPLKGWRRKVRTLCGHLFRLMYVVGSANWIKVKGKLASPKEAPILIGGPHTSFFDALIVIISGPASVVGKVEAGKIPFFGKIIDLAQPIYVCRENHDSRSQTIQDIYERTNSDDDWPHTLIFPEGTCTNKKSMVQFKPGAFNPGLPVQPVVIRYPNKVDTLTWAWQGPNVFILFWRSLSQLHTYIEVEYLPVYNPSEEEIKNPKLFASNVQKIMAKAMNLPISDYNFDDCKLMDYAQKCKLKFAPQIADVAKFRHKIGLSGSNIEECIANENFEGTADFNISFDEFINRLKIPADDISYTLFSIFSSEEEATVIDFKEYLLHSLFLIKIRNPKIELVMLLFKVYGDCGRLPRESFCQIIKLFLKLSSTDINKLFFKLDKDEKGYILFEDFRKATEKEEKFRYLYEPNQNFRQKTN